MVGGISADCQEPRLPDRTRAAQICVRARPCVRGTRIHTPLSRSSPMDIRWSRAPTSSSDR